MPGFENFPQDGNLWVVKWIDKVRIGHRGTTSASISVLLQKLYLSDPKLIHRITSNDLQKILSPPANQEVIFTEATILVGSLPDISIGAVFKDRDNVGHLPVEIAHLQIPLGEVSCESRQLDIEIQSHPEWTKSIPYRVLNRFEYALEFKSVSKSHCLVFKTGKIEYVIPRSVIFKTYYAQTHKLAQAFTNGDWPSQIETLIYTKPLESGLRTWADPQTGEWNIVLQLNVSPDLSPLLGIYYFDPYGIKCAESIYKSILKTQINNRREDWFADAKIPFEIFPEKPLKLSVCGYTLKRYSKAPPDAPDRFLVTRILRSSLPELPAINHACFINGQQGEEQIEVDSPAPFTHHNNFKMATDSTKLSDASDASKTSETTIIQSESFSWIDPPIMRQMKKDSSKSYNSPSRLPKPEARNPDVVSPGNSTYSQDALPEAQTKMLKRAPDRRFTELIAVLENLKEKGQIFGYVIVPPLLSTQRADVGGLDCWNFLDDKSRKSGKWPKKGWRMKIDKEKTPKGKTVSNAQPRAALVVQIDYKENDSGYWIEIEVKSATFKSPYITNVSCDCHQIIQDSLEVIANNKGIDLAVKLNNKITSETALATIYAYKHGYHKDSEGHLNGQLSSDSVLTFLKKCHTPETSS